MLSRKYITYSGFIQVFKASQGGRPKTLKLLAHQAAASPHSRKLIIFLKQKFHLVQKNKKPKGYQNLKKQLITLQKLSKPFQKLLGLTLYKLCVL